MMYAFCLSCQVRLLLSSLAVLYHAEWVAAKGLFVVLMCCVLLWFKLKYKVKIKVQKYCERKRNTLSNHEIQQTNGQRTYIVLAQNF